MNKSTSVPRRIARDSGAKLRTVYRYLLERFPDHEMDSWWRISEEEVADVVRELRTAMLASPSQPLRALRGPQMMFEFT